MLCGHKESPGVYNKILHDDGTTVNEITLNPFDPENLYAWEFRIETLSVQLTEPITQAWRHIPSEKSDLLNSGLVMWNCEGQRSGNSAFLCFGFSGNFVQSFSFHPSLDFPRRVIGDGQ